MTSPGPPAGSDDELRRFAELQERLAPMFRDAYADPRAPRTVVVIPSMSLDPEVLAKIHGVQFYEERLLSMLMLLRLPRTNVVFVTSQPLTPVTIDYHLQLLGGVPAGHARKRLTLLSAHDASPRALTDKLLDRPRLLARIRAAIPEPSVAHMTCFNATHRERTLAVELGIPLYACDPALVHLGSKSGSRETFRAVSVPMPPGHEQLRDERDLAAAITAMRRVDPSLRRVVVKLDEGFSGEGNAILDLDDAPSDVSLLTRWVDEALVASLRCEADEYTPERYLEKFRSMGGIVEAWIEGDEKRSPSVQMRVNAVGELELISTHDQVLGGRSGQVFLGSTFPADPAYRDALHEAGWRVGGELARHGVRGRFAVDFVAVRRGDGWDLSAIEINLRKGGTTLPFQMLQFLTDGQYDERSGRFVTPMGHERTYYASDNVVSPAYRRLCPEDLIDIIVEHGLHFDATRQEGVVFNLIGAMSEHGKLGLVCIAETLERATALSRRTIETLDRETGHL